MSKSDIITNIYQFILENNLIISGDRIIIGVSGGADSVALVYILKELQSKINYELFLCHLNHKIRNLYADADEQYCKQ